MAGDGEAAQENCIQFEATAPFAQLTYLRELSEFQREYEKS